MAFNRLTLIKLIELALAVAIFWMHYETYEAKDFVQLFVITTAFSGFLVVTVGTFLGLVTNNSISRTVDMFFCVAGVALYIAAGVLCIQYFHGWSFRTSTANLGLAKGSLSLIEGVVFFVDAFVTFRA